MTATAAAGNIGGTLVNLFKVAAPLAVIGGVALVALSPTVTFAGVAAGAKSAFLAATGNATVPITPGVVNSTPLIAPIAG